MLCSTPFIKVKREKLIFSIEMEFWNSEFSNKSKLFIVDLDSTICFTESARPPYRPRDANDFVIPAKILQTLREESKKRSILIVTNQTNYPKNEIVQERMKNIEKYLSPHFNFAMYILFTEEWKKPSTKFFTDIVERFGEFKTVKMMGDACKELSDDPAYSWSNSDYETFVNLTVAKKEFHTPYQFDMTVKCRKTNLILMVGPPGSGKSTCAQDLGFEILSNDLGHTKVKQLRRTKECLSSGQSVIIDNTNPDRKTREPFIAIARALEVKIIIIWCLRDGRAYNQVREKPVPEIAFNTYSKRFERPSLEECDIIYELF